MATATEFVSPAPRLLGWRVGRQLRRIPTTAAPTTCKRHNDQAQDDAQNHERSDVPA